MSTETNVYSSPDGYILKRTGLALTEFDAYTPDHKPAGSYVTLPAAQAALRLKAAGGTR